MSALVDWVGDKAFAAVQRYRPVLFAQTIRVRVEMIIFNYDKGTATVEDLRTAEQHIMYATELIPASHGRYGDLMLTVSRVLSRLSKVDQDAEMLEFAVDAASRCAASVEVDDKNWPRYLENLTFLRLEKYERSGDPEQLRLVVRMCRLAIDTTAKARPEYLGTVGNLSAALTKLFVATGDIDLLDEAVEISRALIDVMRADDPRQAAHHARLAVQLMLRYRSTSSQAALEEAVLSSRSGLARTPPDDPEYAVYLSDLGIILMHYYMRSGSAQQLLEAVRVARAAVACEVGDQVSRAKMLSNLSEILRMTFEFNANRSMLHEAIRVGRAALVALPAHDVNRSTIGAGLAYTLRLGYGLTGDSRLLEEAADVGRAALSAMQPTHIDRASCLANVSHVLFLSDGHDEAVRVTREALAATSDSGSQRAHYLATLGLMLQWRYSRTADVADLNEAIDVGRAAVAAAPQGQTLAKALEGLASALIHAHNRHDDPALLAEASDLVTAALAGPEALMSARVNFGASLGLIQLSLGRPDSALSTVESLVHDLPKVAPRAWNRADREYGIGRISGFAADVAAAAVAAGKPERAVELLEQARGLLLGETIEERRDLRALRHSVPAAAAEFIEIRDRFTALDAVIAGVDGPVTEDAAASATHVDDIESRRAALSESWQSVLEKIRSTTGFEDFLLPSDIDRLRRQAVDGPIVMIYSGRDRRSGGALVVSDDSDRPVRAVDLPLLTTTPVRHLIAVLTKANADAASSTFASRASGRTDLHEILEWLWDAAIEPVFGELDVPGRGVPIRIRWCPIGTMALLPIHAAGYHRAGDGRTVFDRADSSYITTIRALEHLRSRPSASSGSAVVIAMPSTPDAPPLDETICEADLLRRLLPEVETLIGTEATRASVSMALHRHTIAHFACHGVSDLREPAAGRLLLHDHRETPLTVRHLAELDLESAELAYLSACSTAHTGAQFTDEAIHLAASIQLAGFRHVVGTLWPVNDRAAAIIADGFYTRITGNGVHAPDTFRSAAALAATLREYRDTSPQSPTEWAAHVHYGL